MLYCIRNLLWIAPIFVLAGCWQKIEYTGKPVAAAKTPVSSTVATSNATEAKPAELSPQPTQTQAAPPIAEVASVPPAPACQPPPAMPVPAAPAATKSKPV